MSNVISIKTIKIVLGVLAVTALLAFVGFAAVANASFDRSLKQGMTGDDVMELQELLNSDVDTMVASTGVGSSGSETKYFGSLTKAAVVKFQNKYASEVLTPIGLTSGTGYFGTMSRAKANAILAGGTTTTTTPGCDTGDLFSSTTGAACVTTTTPVTTYPAGCTSATGFSTTTGASCATTTYPAGCTSATGFSTTTGASCATGVVPTGTSTVSLSADNPATGIIIETQAAADLLHLTFSGTYSVTNLKLSRLGISTSSTLSNVYLFDGNTRLTDAASINSTGEISWNQPSGLFTVTGSRTISVRANVADAMSGQTIGLAFKEGMAGTTAITGTASGNLFSIASNPLTMSTVVFGTVTPTGATINPGANVTLWQSTATIGNNDVYLDRLTFRQVGSATAAAFANFKLFAGGVEVATAESFDSNGYVTFVPTTPVLMSSSRVIRVDADVVSGASRTVQLSLRTAADGGLRDSQLGVNVVATGIPATSATANTISGASGGTMTVARDISSPSTNLTLNGSDVNIGTFKVTAYGEPIKIETLTVGGTFNGALGLTNNVLVTLRNGRIMIGGTQYGSTSTLVAAGTAFTLNYTVTPGTPVLLEVHADIYDNEGTGALDASDTILATIIAGSSNAQRVDSLGTLSVPGTAVSANTLTIATTSVTLSRNSSYSASQTTALPANAFKIGSYNLAGSSIENILLTTIGVDIGTTLVGAGFDYLDVSNLYPVVKDSSGNVVAQPAPLGTVAATNNNFSVNYTLAKNTSVTLELFADLADDGTGTIDATDSFDTVVQVTGTSLVSGQTILGGNGTTTVVGQAIAYAAASVTVAKDASAPVTSIVYDNQTVTTLAAKFSAVTAGYNITDMTVTLGANSDTVVQSVLLYDGTTLIAQTPMSSSTTAVFSGLSWNIPASTSKVLTVKVQLGSVGTGAGTSGANITTSIAAATDVVYTNTSTGVSTSSSTEEAGTATGSTIYAYASTPTVTYVALPTTILSAGTKVLAKFDVTSNGGDIAWKQVLFDISKSDAPTISSVELYNVTGGANILVTAAEVFQNGNGTVASVCDDAGTSTICELLITINTNTDDNVEEQVSGTKTYEVRATIAGTLAAANSISTSIQANVGHFASGVFVNSADGADNDLTVDDSSFVWSDLSGSGGLPHDTGTADWVNENLVRTLPTSTWTMTFPSS